MSPRNFKNNKGNYKYNKAFLEQNKAINWQNKAVSWQNKEKNHQTKRKNSVFLCHEWEYSQFFTMRGSLWWLSCKDFPLLPDFLAEKPQHKFVKKRHSWIFSKEPSLSILNQKEPQKKYHPELKTKTMEYRDAKRRKSPD